MISAGRLKHRVLIQKRIETTTGTGAVKITWEDFAANVAAEVKPLSVKELLAGNHQIKSQVVARITLRYRSDLTPDMRILFRNQIYNIAGILPDADSGLEYITIPVSTGVNDG